MTTSNEHSNAPAVPQGLPECETKAMHDAVMSVLYKGVDRMDTDKLWQAYRSVLLTATPAPAPAVPQGWKSVLVPTKWTIGPSLFKDWCSQWFGHDADDELLMRAAHALLGIAATPAPAPAQERCHLCDCTGDIHDATGEWRGVCPHCKPAQEDEPDPTLSAMMGMPVSRKVWAEFKAWQADKEEALRAKGGK